MTSINPLGSSSIAAYLRPTARVGQSSATAAAASDVATADTGAAGRASPKDRLDALIDAQVAAGALSDVQAREMKSLLPGAAADPANEPGTPRSSANPAVMMEQLRGKLLNSLGYGATYGGRTAAPTGLVLSRDG